MTVGIEAMAFHGPHHYLEMADLAVARGVEPAKYLKGIGQERMAVATPCEDTVTLAANAALKALTNFDIDPAEIGTLVVGTETGVDHSKPVAVYVHEMLGLRSNCRTFETKHACYGAMAGLSSACDWVLAGRARGSKALIIAADIARYGIGQPGEPTQGAGAVAMVVSGTPRLLAFDPLVTGDFTRQVMDFWRPLYSKFAFADGHYSIECYLEALEGAWKDAMEKTDVRELFSIKALGANFYHVPFTRMAKKAHHRHWEIETGETIGKEHPLAASIEATYEAQVAPWLHLNAQVGNIYTGSLFLALIDYLRKAQGQEGVPVSLFSYGSGCGAAYSIAKVAPGYWDLRKKLDPEAELAARRRLTVEAYEAIMTESEDADHNNPEMLNPERWGLDGPFLYLGTRDHIRHYSKARIPAGV